MDVVRQKDVADVKRAIKIIDNEIDKTNRLNYVKAVLVRYLGELR